jgi:hypothetical protein
MQGAGPIAPEEMSAADRALLDHPASKAVWKWIASRQVERPERGAAEPHLCAIQRRDSRQRRVEERHCDDSDHETGGRQLLVT